jgi:lipoprotein-anchoring transpeptidase ErfK/SrfK
LRLQAAQALQEGVSGSANQVFTSEYGSVKDAGYRIPAVPISKVKERYHRQIVSYRTREKPGTIIVDTPNRYLYFVLPGRKAVRYGIGVGKAGFAWEGEAYIAWKQAWPKWTPPKEMIQRRPDLARYGKDGMKPGLRNPLGARALYLFNQDGEDTLFRLHGTPEWNSIGTAASSGCIRLMNQDIIDLYERVRPGRGAKVVVKQ